MRTSAQPSLLDIVGQKSNGNYTGALTVYDGQSAIQLWFVRGNLAHATSSTGETGWKALEGSCGSISEIVEESEGTLPPERSIRVDTGKLLKAVRSVVGSRSIQRMYVPVPLHSRLQAKFAALRKKSSGLRSYETGLSPHDPRQTPDISESEGTRDRIVVERDPMGSTYIHKLGVQQLIVRGDENITTAELMWAGNELWKELLTEAQGRTENE